MNEPRKNLHLRLRLYTVMKRMSKAAVWLGIAAFFLLLILANVNDATPGFLATLALFFLVIPYILVCLALQFGARILGWKLRSIVKNDILPALLRELFGECQYDPDERIPDALLQATNTIPASRYQGSDLVTGTYKGMEFTMCSITAYEYKESDDPDAKGTTVVTNTFTGRWMIVKTSLRPPETICVREYDAELGYEYANPVRMESIAFNERFEVAGDPLNVFRFITPPMIERLLKADTVDNGAVIRFRYLPDGTVGITAHTGRDAGSLDGYKTEDELKDALRADIRLLLDVVDALELKA